MSRADLARGTELTPATVSALVAELEAEGLVTEAGTRRGDDQVGKPPTMLRVRPKARNFIALDLSDPQTMRAAVIDLAGTVISDVNLSARGATGDEALERIEVTVAQALEKANAPILGIGVGTPGVVSGVGEVVEAWHFGWHHVALANRLEDVFGFPTHVSNDANAAAIAEYTRGGHEVSNLAVVKIGSGVGAGFVLNGLPYRGEHAAAGEMATLSSTPRARCAGAAIEDASKRSSPYRALRQRWMSRVLSRQRFVGPLPLGSASPWRRSFRFSTSTTCWSRARATYSATISVRQRPTAFDVVASRARQRRFVSRTARSATTWSCSALPGWC